MQWVRWKLHTFLQSQSADLWFNKQEKKKKAKKSPAAPPLYWEHLIAPEPNKKSQFNKLHLALPHQCHFTHPQCTGCLRSILLFSLLIMLTLKRRIADSNLWWPAFVKRPGDEQKYKWGLDSCVLNHILLLQHVASIMQSFFTCISNFKQMLMVICFIPV